jgi:hypothetical protein
LVFRRIRHGKLKKRLGDHNNVMVLLSDAGQSADEKVTAQCEPRVRPEGDVSPVEVANRLALVSALLRNKHFKSAQRVVKAWATLAS